MSYMLCQLFTLLQLADEVQSAVDEALTPFGLTRATWQALFHLSRKGAQSQGELADHAGCAASNITRLVDRLEEQGFVERVPSEDDRRRVLARLTPQGRETYDAACAVLADLQLQLMSRLSDAETKCEAEDAGVDAS